ncbi:DUF1902 domain-containing protein [Mitsuaria sp. 7]|uniref:DUF1902 domain-containing protein n=1 Tax=Mitsuaria sp. 7 TaxID=1658665 RepID=UPI0007DCD20B|nr:DUF1902 domain-containing protein [Mitsuaria sp. 7]ANH68777.1 hypothetical protein ABE85_16505 [Mitsuaria sp. 7]
MPQPFQIDVSRDVAADVWIAQSSEVPGLAIEANDLVSLDDRLQQIVPELLEANGCAVGPTTRWTYLLRLSA